MHLGLPTILAIWFILAAKIEAKVYVAKSGRNLYSIKRHGLNNSLSSIFFLNYQ
jgi:hypothetical protein